MNEFERSEKEHRLSLFGRKTPSELESRLAKAEADLRQIQLEWESTLDKLQRWMQRAGARAKVDAAAPSYPSANGGTDPVSARILARRARTSLDREHVDEEER